MLQRHSRIAFSGSHHFVTTVTSARGNIFTDPEICRRILEHLEDYRNRFQVDCLGYVLMPDHLHLLLHQVHEGTAVPDMIRDFKKITSRDCRPPFYRARSLWRSRFDDVPVPGTDAVLTKLQYMHMNPVRKGIVERMADYEWSSAREYLLGIEGIVRICRY
jgi:putative transposase